MLNNNKNCISYWFPILEKAGIRVPKTKLIHTNVELDKLLDGETPEGFIDFINDLEKAIMDLGWGLPVFLRTGQTSAKHEWDSTCFVKNSEKLGSHVARIVNYSAMAGFLGLPTNVWAVREFLPLLTAMKLPGYENMPFAREYRGFIRDGEVECIHFYWPEDSIKQGKPEDPQWQAKYEWISIRTLSEDDQIKALLESVANCFTGFWSVDVCQHENGDWYVTDMALGDESFHWKGCDVQDERTEKQIAKTLVDIHWRVNEMYKHRDNIKTLCDTDTYVSVTTLRKSVVQLEQLIHNWAPKPEIDYKSMLEGV